MMRKKIVYGGLNEIRQEIAVMAMVTESVMNVEISR